MLNFFKTRKQALPGIDLNKSINETRYVVIDTELTGLNERNDSIISIGAVRMTGTRIELGNSFHELVNPKAEFKRESVVIHGITPSEVVEKPKIDAILTDFIEYCGQDVIVGHCVSIDMVFINREMKRLFGETVQNPVIDTLNVYGWLRRKLPSRQCFSGPLKDSALYEIAKCFGITIRGAHDALVDSFITAQLFQRFIPLLITAGVENTGRLLNVGNPSEGGDRFKPSSDISNF